MLWPKKTKQKTNSCGSKIALPFPHNFSNGSSLIFLLHIMCTYHHRMTSGTVGPEGLATPL